MYRVAVRWPKPAIDRSSNTPTPPCAITPNKEPVPTSCRKILRPLQSRPTKHEPPPLTTTQPHDPPALASPAPTPGCRRYFLMKTTLTITTLFLLSLAGQAQVPIRDTTGQRGTLLINNSRAKTAVGASAAILPAEQALQVPEPARQYLLRSQQQFQTVPVCDYAGPLQTIAVVNAPFTQDRLTCVRCAGP